MNTPPPPPTPEDVEAARSAWREMNIVGAGMLHDAYGEAVVLRRMEAALAQAREEGRREGEADTKRLDWLIHHGAQVRFDADDSRVYIVMPYHCGVPWRWLA